MLHIELIWLSQDCQILFLMWILLPYIQMVQPRVIQAAISAMAKKIKSHSKQLNKEVLQFSKVNCILKWTHFVLNVSLDQKQIHVVTTSECNVVTSMSPSGAMPAGPSYSCWAGGASSLSRVNGPSSLDLKHKTNKESFQWSDLTFYPGSFTYSTQPWRKLNATDPGTNAHYNPPDYWQTHRDCGLYLIFPDGGNPVVCRSLSSRGGNYKII